MYPELPALKMAAHTVPYEPEFLAIVRCGAEATFRTLNEEFGGDSNFVRVVWDKRRKERRRAYQRLPSERRAADRRQPPAFTWDLLDFVLVRHPPGKSGP